MYLDHVTRQELPFPWNLVAIMRSETRSRRLGTLEPDGCCRSEET